ncbi:plant-specific TFIIB-related protein PTF2 [Dendrobium catenatum]|uniref:BRF2-like C-terminal domain-containing protein n=1 Tax=Dendrobium catenatum TaxID=906689 RepID=A0A2I0XJF8_9ASPA|nr:plant-specific TFIIB-related protein PTF2 [Dendrobium catenatum]PKU88038.1 hypothetical protein MA16_Dca019488 [Dendrobium catenatum]
MDGEVCRNCGEPSVITDLDTNIRVCESCGSVQSSDAYQDQAFDRDGTRLGTLHSSGDFGYRERKLYHARALIADITARLNLTKAHASAVSRLACQATDDNLGSGDWFPVLVAACAVIVMRQHGSPLSLAEAAEAIGRDPHDLGRMVGRVSRHLDLGQLPELNAVCLLERAVRELSPFSTLDKDKFEEILGQGRFILHCAIRWFLTTGRHPLPVVAAVLIFVSKVNGLEVGVEEIAGMIHAGVATSHRRLKELMEVLVKVAKKLLPWGNDVTVKNIVHNAPVLIRFMELKSKANLSSVGNDNGCVPDLGFNLNVILNAYSNHVDAVPEESKYFRLGKRDGGDERLNWDELEKLKLSAEGIRLSHDYGNVLDRLPGICNEGEIEKRDGINMRRTGLEIEDWIESWKGRWKSDKGLTLQQVLQRSEGFDALPPSFMKGMDMRRMRRMKMEAAKHRIHRTMKRAPVIVERVPCSGEDDRLKEHLPSRKRRKRDGVIDGLDWEDCIIELLLLHQVDEEQIEQGHYNRLLDLYVFSSSAL